MKTAYSNLWVSSPKTLLLSYNDIHLWCAKLDVLQDCVEQLAQHLSLDEQKRAERFRFERHRRRFIVARGLLRDILACYANVSPRHFEFSYSERGKPELAHHSMDKRLCFNISHSHELALYAITYEHRIGVDIEYTLNRKTDVEHLAKRFFLPHEYDVIRNTPPTHKHELFFKCWTIKEAYLKATGEGLAGLEQVEISFAAGQPNGLLSIKQDSHAASRWSVYQLAIPKAGYTAALVVEGRGYHLTFDSLIE